jgi:hypothetical protein
VTTKGRYSYFVEAAAVEGADRPRRFLEAFAAVLEHGNYAMPLDVYARLSAKCSRCAAACQPTWVPADGKRRRANPFCRAPETGDRQPRKGVCEPAAAAAVGAFTS